jgi:hypothetical protein
MVNTVYLLNLTRPPSLEKKERKKENKKKNTSVEYSAIAFRSIGLIFGIACEVEKQWRGCPASQSYGC